MPPTLPEADTGIDAALFDDESAPSSSKKARSSFEILYWSVGKSTTTPKSATSSVAPKSAGRSTGRKRKAEEIEPEENAKESEKSEPEAEVTPAAKRGGTGRPARTAGKATSAQLSLKAAKKPTRGRPKGPGASAEKKEKTKAVKNTILAKMPVGRPGRRGRPAKA
ncbi:hypothetical protein QBC36DRAFT_285800 [Triangularia setosa]|uniref:Uncharacterized protein n=1 Tax=Triangularia setosa TaxID=2587417 RepID=A0AAN6WGJ8_9PEZI|nr:hypothetical protein QBC36DRAFT_285800 [Podospora setosa]